MANDLKALTTAQLVKDLYTSQIKRREEQKRLDLMEEVEKSLALELQSRTDTGKVKGFVVLKKTVAEPFANDWGKLIDYIKETGEIDLLEKRLLKSAVKARWDELKSVPGVIRVEKTTLKVEKSE